MMKSAKLAITLILTVLLIQTTAFATASISAQHASKACDFIPKNSLKIPVGLELMGGIDEATFNKVIDNVSSFYSPIIKAQGGTLKVNRLWTDATVNASAQRKGKTWILNMYGGLARHAITTEDGFALVMCHEMGHQLGGYPEFAHGNATSAGRDWAANEGQADYFATMKCFRRVYEKADNASAISSLSVPAIVKTQCSNTFKSQLEINLCVRESMAGNTLALLLWTLSNGGTNVTKAGANIKAGAKQPAFDTPDSAAVSTTDDSHPAAQCRLDTYFNGSICGAAFSQDFGKSDPITGACASEKGDKVGTRPLCWYKPKN